MVDQVAARALGFALGVWLIIGNDDGVNRIGEADTCECFAVTTHVNKGFDVKGARFDGIDGFYWNG